MTKKIWSNPTINDLSINKTELGPDIKPKHDLVYVDEDGNEYWTHIS